MKLENNFGKIKADIKDNVKQTEYYARMSEPLWRQYDSSITEFGGSFFKSLPKEYTEIMDKKLYVSVEEIGMPFKEYIEKTLSQSKNKELFAIEFGGPGSSLFQGFKEGLFNKTIGVCLKDIRHSNSKYEDNQNSHFLVKGDILQPEDKKLVSEIKHLLGTNKVDLIVSRMMGPLKELNRNPAILNNLVKNWYKMLNENGLLFAQFEYFGEHNPNMEQKYGSMLRPEDIRESELYAQYWVEEIKKKYPDLIDVQLGRGVLRLHKKEGAPEELPDMGNIMNK